MAEQVCKNCGEGIVEGPSGFWGHNAGHACCGPNQFADPSPEPRCNLCREPIAQGPGGIWVHTTLSPRHPANPAEPQQANAEPEGIQRYDIKRCGGVDRDDALAPYEYGGVVKTEDHVAQLAQLRARVAMLDAREVSLQQIIVQERNIGDACRRDASRLGDELLSEKIKSARLEEACAFIASQEDYTFAECTVAEGIIGRAKEALGGLDSGQLLDSLRATAALKQQLADEELAFNHANEVIGLQEKDNAALKQSLVDCVQLLEKYGPQHGMPEDIEAALAAAAKLTEAR